MAYIWECSKQICMYVLLYKRKWLNEIFAKNRDYQNINKIKLFYKITIQLLSLSSQGFFNDFMNLCTYCDSVFSG